MPIVYDEGQTASAVSTFKGGSTQMQTLSSDMDKAASTLADSGMKGASGEALRNCAQDWKNISGKVAEVLREISEATNLAGQDLTTADQHGAKRFGKG
jgi:WXG100 family type VII secretion target